MKKICTICKKHKPISSFSRKPGRVDGHSSECKECHKIYRQSYYKRFKNKEIQRVQDRRRATNQRLLDLKKTLACLDCGVKDFRVLEFDHLGDKEIDVSQASMNGWSWKRIESEIAKCEPVCANCHRIRTFKRRAGLV